MRIKSFADNSIVYAVLPENGTVNKVHNSLNRAVDWTDVWRTLFQQPSLTHRNHEQIGILELCFRTFRFVDDEIFLNLFKSIVRPHLEYGLQCGLLCT